VEVQRYLDNLIQKFKDPDKTAQVSAQEWAEARAQIAPALRRDSGNYELQARDYLAQGQIKFLEKDYFEALQRFREGVRLMPNSAVLRYALGTTFLVGNQPNEAIEQFRAAVAQESSFALAHKALGDAYTKLGDTKNANNEYLRARTLGFRSADISAALGRNLMREPTWQQAVTELNAAAESKPTVATYLDLATCYDALKRPFAQVDALLSAIKIDPNAAEPYYKLGEIYFANNEFLKAAEAFEKYLFKAPEDPKPRRDTARLRANEARRRAESGK
jgi:tetratricopeptide (TPR) repeat protein